MAKKSQYADEDEDSPDVELLPAISPPAHLMNRCEPEPLKPTATDEQIIIEDLKAINLSAAAIHQAWKSVTSIQEVCQLVGMTGRLISDRRKALGRQHGPKTQITDGRGFVYPID